MLTKIHLNTFWRFYSNVFSFTWGVGNTPNMNFWFPFFNRFPKTANVFKSTMLNKSPWDTDAMLWINLVLQLEFEEAPLSFKKPSPTPPSPLNKMLKLGRNCTSTCPTLQFGWGEGPGKCSCTRLVWRAWKAPLVQICRETFVLDCSLELFCHHLLKTTSQGIVTCFSVSQLYRVYWALCHCKRISDCPICVLLVLPSAKISDCALKGRINELILFLFSK